MKIAFLAPIPVKECKRIKTDNTNTYDLYWLLQLALEIAERGHSVDIVSMESEEEEHWFNGNIGIHIFKCAPRPRIAAIQGFKKETKVIANYLINNSYDVIHAHWSYEYALAALLTNREKTLITLHDWPYEIEKYLKRPYMRLKMHMSKNNIRKGKWFTAVSPYMCEMSKTRVKNVVMVPNWVTADCYYEDRIIEPLSGRKVLFISANNEFTERKNVTQVIKVFRGINRTVDSELHLYGAGYGLNEEAMQWAVNNNIDITNIVFHGSQSHADTVNMMKKCDFMLSCSREESFGLTYAEAMAAKCVAIGGNNSGAVPWVLDYGNAGLLIDVEEESSAVSEIIDLIYDEERRKKYIENGYIRAKNEFCVENTLRGYIEAYKKIVE